METVTCEKPKQGLWITMDGLDGAGKTTQLKQLKDWFIEQGHDVLLVREPGGVNDQLGTAFRELFFEAQGFVPPEVEVGLLCASFKYNIEKHIMPALEAGKIVLQDRSEVSLICYQGGGKEYDIEMIYGMLERYGLNEVPDIQVYLAITPELAKKRSIERGVQNSLDDMPVEFYERVQRMADAILGVSPTSVYTISAMPFVDQLDTIADVQLELRKFLANYIEKANENEALETGEEKSIDSPSIPLVQNEEQLEGLKEAATKIGTLHITGREELGDYPEMKTKYEDDPEVLKSAANLTAAGDNVQEEVANDDSRINHPTS